MARRGTGDGRDRLGWVSHCPGTVLAISSTTLMELVRRTAGDNDGHFVAGNWTMVIKGK